VTDSWNVVRRPAAIDDIEAIWRYLIGIDESLADSFLARMDEAAATLTHFPERGALREFIAPGVRGLLISPWLVLYRADRPANSVEIVRVVDGRRNLAVLISL
jgi:toxin ParE1/3/4